VGPSRSNLGDRNRKTMRVLLAIALGLAAATILVGVRW
jgi:hypothetical protein